MRRLSLVTVTNSAAKFLPEDSFKDLKGIVEGSKGVMPFVPTKLSLLLLLAVIVSLLLRIGKNLVGIGHLLETLSGDQSIRLRALLFIGMILQCRLSVCRLDFRLRRVVPDPQNLVGIHHHGGILAVAVTAGTATTPRMGIHLSIDRSRERERTKERERAMVDCRQTQREAQRERERGRPCGCLSMWSFVGDRTGNSMRFGEAPRKDPDIRWKGNHEYRCVFVNPRQDDFVRS